MYNSFCRNGEVPEWLKGADCKSAAFRFVGSNPTLTTTDYRGVEQLVARRAHNPKVVGSSPSSATKSDTTIDTICASSGIVVLYSI